LHGQGNWLGMGLGRAALAVVVQVQQIAAVLPLVWVSFHHRIEHRAMHLRRGLHAVKGVDIGDLSAQFFVINPHQLRPWLGSKTLRLC